MNSLPMYADVVVVGSGNAALSAALSAHEQGARVLVIEKAPLSRRGGNSKFTGGVYRFTHDGFKDIHALIPDISEEVIRDLQLKPYLQDDFYNDLMMVTEGLADPELSGILVNESYSTIKWLTELGLKWELLGFERGPEGVRRLMNLVGGILPLSTPEGGAGLVRMLSDMVEAKGIDVIYETKARKLLMDSKGRVNGLAVQTREGYSEIKGKAIVLACGSFESNSEMRTKYLGPLWNTVKVRGTRHNTGEMLKEALEIGAQPAGHWGGQHASPIHADAGDVEDGLETVRYSYGHSVTVNTEGRRFFDEGENFFPLTYAKTGRAILAQPSSLAFQIFDAKTEPMLMSQYGQSTIILADSLVELEDKLDIEAGHLTSVIEQFNAAVSKVPFNPEILDGKATVGIEPGKSNWAQEIDVPPFKACPVVCGITFAFGCVKINAQAQVVDTEGNVIPGLYAAGEIGGGIFYHNYPGASGLTKGAVFGRIAGANAAGE